MIKKISEFILSKIIGQSDSQNRREIILFGIIRIVEDITKMIVIFIICLLLGRMKELIFIFIITIIYKTNVGGVHCKTNLWCFINTLLFFLICIYGSEFIVFTSLMKIGVYSVLYLFGLYVIAIYVPADVPEIPIMSKKYVKEQK